MTTPQIEEWKSVDLASLPRIKLLEKAVAMQTYLKTLDEATITGDNKGSETTETKKEDVDSEKKDGIKENENDEEIRRLIERLVCCFFLKFES